MPSLGEALRYRFNRDYTRTHCKTNLSIKIFCNNAAINEIILPFAFSAAETTLRQILIYKYKSMTLGFKIIQLLMYFYRSSERANI